MRILRLVAALLATMQIAGCSGSSMVIPSTEVIDSTGTIITKTAATVGDTSAYRTKQKYDAWNVAQKEYVKALSRSGFHMAFAMVDVGGQKLYLPKTISFTEAPTFHAPPDLKDHPVWHTIDTAVRTITPWGFGSWAATSIIGSMEAIAKQPTQQYQGPVQMSGSYNQAGRDQSVYAGPVNQDNAARDGSPGNQVGTEPEVSSESALSWCLENPPAGYNQNGTPMATSTESCESMFGGE